jgi:hypothetical protein
MSSLSPSSLFFFGPNQLISPPKWCHGCLALICHFLVLDPHLKTKGSIGLLYLIGHWTFHLKRPFKKRDISGPITEPQGFCYQAGPACPPNPEDDKSVKDPKCRQYLCSAAFLFSLWTLSWFILSRTNRLYLHLGPWRAMAAAVESLDHWWWSMRIFTWYLHFCPHIPTLKRMVMASSSIKHVQQALGLSQSLMQIVHKVWTYLALGLGACSSCLFWET